MPKDNGTLIVFDANLRQSFYSEDVLEQSMMQCNVLKINDEEPDSLSDIRHSGVGSGEPMSGIVEPLQSEDSHSDLRSKRQLHFHA